VREEAVDILVNIDVDDLERALAFYRSTAISRSRHSRRRSRTPGTILHVAQLFDPRSVGVVAAVAVLGCSESTTPAAQAADAQVSDARVEQDSGCLGYECFGQVTCDDAGRVRLSLPALLPCGSGATCPSSTHTCTRGCSRDGLKYRGAPADQYCEENRPKAPGDRCGSDLDCEPSDAGSLGCELDGGVCASRDASATD